MNEEEPQTGAEDQLLRQAASWFARMRGPDAEAHRTAFEQWLGQDAAHRAAYNRASEIFAMGKLLQVEDEQQPRSGAERRHVRQPVLALSAAALLAMAALWSGARLWSDSGLGRNARLVKGDAVELAALSAASDERLLRLSDGSLVRLGPGASVRARFDRASRVLRLDEGLARFSVAHEGRPFVVLSGGGSVTARGTIFDVSLSVDGRVHVQLVEGVVDVRMPPSEAGPSATFTVRRLRPGEAISFAAQDRAPSQRAAEEATAPDANAQARAEQPREFENIALADLAALAAQGGGRPIRFADPSIGAERVSGRFRIDDPVLLAERLAVLFNMVVDRRDPSLLLLKRK